MDKLYILFLFNKSIVVLSKAYKNAKGLLIFKEGIRPRIRLNINPKSIYRRTKNNIAYCHFSHSMKDKAIKDFYFLAID